MTLLSAAAKIDESVISFSRFANQTAYAPMQKWTFVSLARLATFLQFLSSVLVVTYRSPRSVWMTLPRPQGDCDAQCALRRALLDSLSQGYARHHRGPLQQEMEVAAARRPGTRAYQLRVRAALMDSLCYPSGNQKR
ncbi:hypothetical protein HPB50_017216 [Hyalomma asiaticum]|uniref:Uncharacterized protein n=1 Tax=Hyalomma asiaticum TaxID=266040 RepID=A0ACB7RIE4_HYAAI|nr:hypothetical protein HPB50_017216 [Hyalomma asiaticum]